MKGGESAKATVICNDGDTGLLKSSVVSNIFAMENKMDKYQALGETFLSSKGMTSK